MWEMRGVGWRGFLDTDEDATGSAVVVAVGSPELVTMV
jgi:hypothetical protein